MVAANAFSHSVYWSWGPQCYAASPLSFVHPRVGHDGAPLSCVLSPSPFSTALRLHGTKGCTPMGQGRSTANTQFSHLCFSSLVSPRLRVGIRTMVVGMGRLVPRMQTWCAGSLPYFYGHDGLCLQATQKPVVLLLKTLLPSPGHAAWGGFCANAPCLRWTQPIHFMM